MRGGNSRIAGSALQEIAAHLLIGLLVFRQVLGTVCSSSMIMMESGAFFVGVIVGILATVTMDVGAMIAFRFGIAGRGPRRTGPDLIGRWIGYLLRGKFRHTDILQTPPLPGELLLGFAAHYSDRDRADPCVPWSISCGPCDSDRTQRHSLRNGHHGFTLVSNVPVAGDGLAGTGRAG